jgi:hypothetical protein
MSSGSTKLHIDRRNPLARAWEQSEHNMRTPSDGHCVEYQLIGNVRSGMALH